MIKKVVHLVYSFGCGGLEKVIANLINHSSQYKVEHLVISLTDDMTMEQQVNYPIKLIVLDKKPGNDISSHKKLYTLLKKIKPSVLNTYNFGTIEYHLIAKFAGVPVQVHSDHGRGGDDPKGKNILHNVFRKFMSLFISEYIVVSYDLYEWVTKDLNIKKSTVSLIFNGVTVPDDFPSVNNTPKTFVTVGRLDPIKNQKLLIDAFAKSVHDADKFGDCQLRIVGDGPLYNELQERINHLSMDKSISMLGYRDDIEKVLNEADVFVLSSLYEAMPMTILEAMANKVPVICTNVGGISQFISEQEAWFVSSDNIASLSEKLVEITEDNKSREQKVNKAYKLVRENYGIDNMVNQYMKKYKISLKNK
jgi:sugar transferase (PEP-CTERM/EpsH1 system associated)